jgi:hypothetical protein
MIDLVKPVAAALLHARLANKLRKPADVQAIVHSMQPTGGFSNQEWQEICGFIVQLRDADKIEEQTRLVNEYQLKI